MSAIPLALMVALLAFEAGAEEPTKEVPERSAEAIADAHTEARIRAERASMGRPITEALVAEFRRHARRTARLDRLHDVAKSLADFDSLKKIQALTDREEQRHKFWIQRYQKRVMASDSPKKKAERAGSQGK